jgi:putative phosphoribosyl transferase
MLQPGPAHTSHDEVEAMFRFANRKEAGRKLSAALEDYADEQPIVLALPRGGVPVAFEVARALDAQLDIWVVRKIGAPWHPELGVGAVAEGGYTYLNQDILDHIGLSRDALAEAIEAKRREVEERVTRFRGGRPAPQLRGRSVLVVDDGIATGGTVRAVLRSLRSQSPKQLVLAVPVAAAATAKALAPELDRLVCLHTPHDLYAIGLWYDDFTQVTDDEVVALLEQARQDNDLAQHAAAR